MNQLATPHFLERLRSVPTLLSLAVGLLGLTVMAGWIVQNQAMVEIRPGLVAMVFNTALCFTLASTALAAPALLQRPLPALQTAVGIFIVILCSLVLVEQALDISLGIDWAFLHGWLIDGNMRLGRMAPNTALGFIFIGLCLILQTRIQSRGQELSYQVMVFLVLAIGLTGLVCYALEQEQLFGWARSARMAVHTGLGMVATSIVLWTSHRHTRAGELQYNMEPDEKIGFMSAGILAVTTATAGMTGFVFQKEILEQTLRERLQFQLDSARHQLQTDILRASGEAGHVLNDTRLAELAAGGASAALSASLQELVRRGASSASLRAANGALIDAAGTGTSVAEALSFPLPAARGSSATLTWREDLAMETVVPLTIGGNAVAHLALRFRLPQAQARLFSLAGLGETGAIYVCTGDGRAIACLPNGRQNSILRTAATNAAGKRFPVALAVGGEAGLVSTIDVRGKNVMAAYGPVAPGIGMVVKQDSQELFGVIRSQLKVVVPALLLLLLLGTLLMRALVRPLARRLLASEQQAREKQREMNTLLANVGEGIMTVSDKGIVESFNDAAACIFGYSAAEVVGQHMQIIMPPEVREAVAADLVEYLDSGDSKIIGQPSMEIPGLRKDGTRFMLELTVREVRHEARRLFVGVLRDITERTRNQEKLTYMAQHDTLTGLPNRALFMDRLAGAIARTRRSRGHMAVMYLDLDGFKLINDTLGHHSGDAVLRQFGERLSKSVRRSDTVARLAGDEFTVILEDLTEPAKDIEQVAEKIIAAMQAPFALGSRSVPVTTSIGIALLLEREDELDGLLRRADAAMYRAKHSGKNRWSN